jgi:hypothetical protein
LRQGAGGRWRFLSYRLGDQALTATRQAAADCLKALQIVGSVIIPSGDCFGTGNCLRIMGAERRQMPKPPLWQETLLLHGFLRDADAGLTAHRNAGCGGLRRAFCTAGG